MPALKKPTAARRPSRPRGAKHSTATFAEPLSLRPPSWLLLALEGRALAEFWACILSVPFINRLPRGDGQPVLVFPGLASGDLSTWVLRKFLSRLGYLPFGWEQGFNAGPRHGVLAGCKERIEELHGLHRRKISLVGWSLGGLYAREMAKLMPEMVRQVVTLGSPFAGDPHANHAWRVFELLCRHRVDDPHLRERLREAPPVPTTSIYSRSDGIVAWQCSVQALGSQSENVEVPSSHFGLGFNPLVLYALADRLSLKEGRWKPFARDGLRGLFFDTPGFS